ncbi:hypothetical protein [Qipengyuania marisflavi]|uniref:Calcium-binding protein n=1 Tax=Qipengyuania marisflavi TaxID=2486356 RepID=A0A5S3Q253_9SPHN|nr:hypothetical protein [Qipengyuania marisflavi]TMM50437.1 hypothetical protein FEV51_04525 [Qipengyuania marisflavi]
MFIFDAALTAANVDHITDFRRGGGDTLELDLSVFSGISGAGVLDASAFHRGTSAADADDRIIYDKDTGNLFYDADGVGGADQVLFATLEAGTNLTAGDIFVAANTSAAQPKEGAGVADIAIDLTQPAEALHTADFFLF